MGDEEVNLKLLQYQVQDLLKWRDDFISNIATRLDKLDDTITKLVAGRPSWGVAIALGSLASLCTGLIVNAIHH